LTEDYNVDRPVPRIDRNAPFTPKVLSLMAALTLDEKISLVHGADPNPMPVGKEFRRGATLTPSGSAWSPTRRHCPRVWDWEQPSIAGQPWRPGELVGNEGRDLGVDLVYAPQVDLTRQPNWDRNNTTYGEDPFLNGELAIQEVAGIQSKGLMSQFQTLYPL
jgi:beta-glucosidase